MSPSPETEPYTYTPLPPNHIRLLVLHPSTRRWSKIHCTLQPHPLNSVPEYKALSYVWGQEPARHTISFTITRDGSKRTMAIRPNLYRALRRLRRARESLRLWVDAVCINQADLDEKQAQIPMMSDIYYNAERVIIWLGERAEHSDSAMALLNRLGHVARLDGLQERLAAGDGGLLDLRGVGSAVKRVGVRAVEALAMRIMRRMMARDDSSSGSFDLSEYDSEPEAVGLDRYRSFESLSDVRLPGRRSRAWRGLRALLDRPWFYRAWVIQEAGLAETVVLVCGRRSIAWGKVGIVAVNMASAGYPEEAGGKLWDNVVRMRMMRRGSWYMGGDSFDIGSFESGDSVTTLAFLLALSGRAEATDPRDKIYALYGFLEIRGHDVPVEVDYRISPQELYRRVALWLIQGEAVSMVLHMAGMRRELQGLPSWVPDWSVPQKDAWRISDLPSGGDSSDMASQLVQESQDPNVLIIGAKVIANITWIGAGIPADTAEKDAREAVETALRDWAHGVAQAAASGSCAFEPFWTALLPTWDASIEELGRQVAAWFSSLHLDVSGLPPPAEGAEPVRDDAVEAIVAQVAHSCIGHRMCLTSTGSLLLAPLRADAGNEVVYFGGCGSLFVVRQEGDDGKALVGACSVPDMEKWADLLPKEESDLVLMRIV